MLMGERKYYIHPYDLQHFPLQVLYGGIMTQVKTCFKTIHNLIVHVFIREDVIQLLEQVQDAKDFSIPRARIDENSTQELIIRAFNLFGESCSDPLVFCVKDICELSFLSL